MSRLKTNGMSIAKFFLGTIGVVSALIVVFAGGPALETKFWPVLSKIEFLEIRSLTDETAVVKVRFTKNRNCEYVGISWYKGTASNISERVTMLSIKEPEDTSSPNRIVGTQDAGPWRINMPAEDVKSKSYVVAYHKCHPFWVTSTVFYP